MTSDLASFLISPACTFEYSSLSRSYGSMFLPLPNTWMH
jgi:hypothetical protein